MNRRAFLKSVGAAAAAMAWHPGAKGQKNAHPNIVYILADDMGYGDVSYLNNDGKIQTPSMDRIGREGVVFTDAHSNSAVCTPTRYGILTGRYAWRSTLKSGVLWGFSPNLIAPDRMTVADLLKEHGYRTSCIGKWHLGFNWATTDGKAPNEENIDYRKPVTQGPKDCGFDYSYIIPASLDMQPYVYIENNVVEEPATGTTQGQKGKGFYRAGPCAPGFDHEEVLPRLTEKAVKTIEDHARDHREKPLFLYFPLNAPHTPILPTPEFKGKSGLSDYGDFVMQVDWTIGQTLNALERNGMADNTLIIVTSDNGCSPMADFKELEEQGHDPSYVFRGHKADIFEGGHRIPFLARWPKVIQPRRYCNQTICLTDLMATAADIVGAELPANAGEDSVSLLPALQGDVKKPLREATVHHSINGSFSIRQGKWKLEFCPGSGGWSDPKPKKARELNLPKMQLYDLEKDIAETKNVYEEHPEVVEKLTKLMKSYIERGRSTPGAPRKNEGNTKLW